MDTRDLAGLAAKKPRPPMILLGTNACGGNTISLLNSHDPGYRSMIEDLMDCRYNYLTMTAEGQMSSKVLKKTREEYAGEYILVVDGTVPTKSGGLYAVVGERNGRPHTALQAVQELGAKAGHVVAMGTCASFGGPFAAAPNPSGSRPVQAVLNRKVINVPGCPVNPGWIMGTLAHLAWYGEPELDELNRPKMFYSETIHNQCQRRHYFDNSIFARSPGEPWCMYLIGCKGPVTYADCPYRQWCGEHVSWPVKANTNCIGCASPEFPDGCAPFFEHLPDVQLPGIKASANRIGMLAGAITALGIGAHLAGSIITGRLPANLGKGFSLSTREKLISKLQQLLPKNK
ncbi:MAG: hydrogenase small subunit [Bacillota bacterium]